MIGIIFLSVSLAATDAEVALTVRDRQLIEKIVDERLQKHFEDAGDAEVGGPVVNAVVARIVQAVEIRIAKYFEPWTFLRANWMLIAGLLFMSGAAGHLAGKRAAVRV